MTQIIEIDAHKSKTNKYRQFVVRQDGRDVAFLLQHLSVHTYRHQGWLLGGDGTVVESTWTRGTSRNDVLSRVLELVS